MITRKNKLILTSVGGAMLALGVGLSTGCELVVDEDLSLVDAGPTDACSLCYDGEVITLDDGNILLVPNDGGTDDGAAASDIDASAASDGEAE